MGLIPGTLCKAHHMYVWHACTNALDDPTRSSGAPSYGIRPVHTLMWYNQIFKIFSTFYLTILGQVDNTLKRKLAHIQRFILLNYYFNSFTDNTVSTLFLGNMRMVSTTGPKVIFIFYFYIFPDTVVSIQLGKIPTFGSRTKIYNYTTHTWMQTTIFGMLNCIAMVAKSNQIHVFSLFR